MDRLVTSKMGPSKTSRAQALGMALGATIAIVPGIWGIVVPSLSAFAAVGILGAPVAAVLGRRFAVEARAGSNIDAAAVAILMGVQVVFYPAAVVVLASLAGGPVVVFVLMGAFAVGIYCLAVTIPCAAVWVLLMRAAPNSLVRDGFEPIRSDIARAAAIVTVVAVTVGGMIIASSLV
jgi:hypothetical protein